MYLFIEVLCACVLCTCSSDGMAGCFDPIRPRTHSFDLHLLMQHTKIMKFSKLFRSRSDSNVKSSPRSSPSVSPRTSPRSSPGAPARRRFMRVVRDEQSSGEEYENPHVIRKYTQKYAETLCLRKSQSMDEPRSLPYTVSGHTILKKFSSFESESATATPDHSPPSSKHASFREEVEVIEYDKKEKIQKHRFASHRERISFDEIEGELGTCSLDDELALAAYPLCEVSEKDEYDAGDEADQDRVCLPSHEDEDVFHFEEDDEQSKNEERPQSTKPKEPSPVVGSPVLARQLSSDSDSSESDRPSRKKKSKIEDLRDTVTKVEAKEEEVVERDGPRRIEVLSPES